MCFLVSLPSFPPCFPTVFSLSGLGFLCRLLRVIVLERGAWVSRGRPTCCSVLLSWGSWVDTAALETSFQGAAKHASLPGWAGPAPPCGKAIPVGFFGTTCKDQGPVQPEAPPEAISRWFHQQFLLKTHVLPPVWGQLYILGGIP